MRVIATVTHVIASERSERGNLKHGADKVAVPFSCRGLPRSRCSLAMTSKPPVTCHCEGIYARGNLSHGADKVAVLVSCRGLLRYARNDK